MSSEKVIEIANKMYQARKTALGLLGPEKFREKVAEYSSFIRGAMKKHECEEITAAMEIITVLQSKGDMDTGVAQMLTLAACVEMIEPMEVV